jgi:dTDP-4-dehydrorhamnose reductase
MQKKKILFTGGAGLLALNWAFATAKNYDVVLGLHKKSISVAGFTTVFIDMETVSGFGSVLRNIQPDIVIHCAGLANVEACEADPGLAYHANVQLSANVANACKQQGVQLVYISTDHLFDGHTPLVTEDEIPAPVNEYGKTKLGGERKTLEISADFLAIRTNFYGWGPSYRRSFSDMIIDNLGKQKIVTLFNDFYYTPIVIEELAETVMELLAKKGNGIFNVTGDERISKFEFGIRLANRFGLNIDHIKNSSFTERKDLVKRPADLSLSNKKVSAFLQRGIGCINDNIEKLYRQQKSGQFETMRNI